MHSCGSSAPHRATSLGPVNAHAPDALGLMARGLPPIAELVAGSPARDNALTFDVAGVHADFTRQRVSTEMWEALMRLAVERDVQGRIAAMFAGEQVNETEHRPALHTALRALPTASPQAAWAHDRLQSALDQAAAIRSDPSVRAVVNIGIGGSHLGPAMVVRALRRDHDGPLVRFVSNVDAADLDAAVSDLDPAHTVFVVSSKTFTTIETMHNAERARQWLTDAGVSWQERFHAVTASPAAAVSAGFLPAHCHEFAEWVGGRFSVSSVIGFPVMCAVGPDVFLSFLEGMRDMDDHVASAEPGRNLPVAHALTWYLNAVVHRSASVAVIPYASDLALLPVHLQQLVMESNGKRVSLHGEVTDGPTSPVVWGAPGTDGQHAFFQLLHQGTSVVPVEFVSTVSPLGDDGAAHDILIANMLAQSHALAVGATSTDPHREFPGDRPSTVLFLDRLDARCLGALVSMYEHSTAIQGWLMGVNSFDQYGVELGKVMASDIHTMITDGPASTGETVTHPLVDWFIKRKQNISRK